MSRHGVRVRRRVLAQALRTATCRAGGCAAPPCRACAEACGARSPTRSVLVGFVYPAFQSWKALESAKGGESAKAGGAPSQSQSAWLTYWVVFSLFNVVEHLADVLVSWCAGAAAAQLQISDLTTPSLPSFASFASQDSVLLHR